MSAGSIGVLIARAMMRGGLLTPEGGGAVNAVAIQPTTDHIKALTNVSVMI